MKNNTIILYIFYFVFLTNILKADPFIFETSNLSVLKGENKIVAGKGKVSTANDEYILFANKFEYIKDKDKLIATGDGNALINSKKLEIFFDKVELDNLKLSFVASGNVVIIDNKRDIKIVTEKIEYDEKKSILKSKQKSIITDFKGNIYRISNFIYDISADIVKLKNLEFTDIKKNRLKTQIAFLNTKSNKLFGKDIEVQLYQNKNFSKNEPRMRGNSIENNNEFSKVTKGIFTNCKKRDGCPPWKLSAKNIQHDKLNQIIKYDQAILHVYDTPIMYFPKFFHPDPTVKRKSGFLVPSIKSSSNYGDFINIPYFLAISDNKDLTFNPRLYTDDAFLIQNEYRQIGKNNFHQADFSIFSKNNNTTKSHFFYNYNSISDTKNFQNKKINLKLQSSSNDTYLKVNKLKSDLITNYSTLENSFNIDMYYNDLSINFENSIYENLDKKSSDRYEYVLPSLTFTKNFEKLLNFNGNFEFSSKNLIRNYDTNITEKTNINNLQFSSNQKFYKNGLQYNHEFLIKNVNSDANNSKKYKNNTNNTIAGVLQNNLSLPLLKENNKSISILEPKISLKIAPEQEKKSVDDFKIDTNNIFALNRHPGNDIVEGGTSLVYGTKYKIFNKSKVRDIFSLSVANNLRIEDEKNLSTNNQINQKTSNFFSEIIFNPNNILNLKYNTSIKNNLSDIDGENIHAELKYKKITTTFDYLNENNFNNTSYLENTTKFLLNNSNSIGFSTRKNKSLNLTEYYNLIYQYKNDCLAASIEYNKDYYSDKDLKPNESLMLKLTIIPFGETSSPNFVK